MYFLSLFIMDVVGQLDVFGYDGYVFGVDGVQVCVFEQFYQVGFVGFLQCYYGRILEVQVCFKVLCDFVYQLLEGQFVDQQFCGFLVVLDFLQGYGVGLVVVWFFYFVCGWCVFVGCFGGQLFFWGFVVG